MNKDEVVNKFIDTSLKDKQQFSSDKQEIYT
jgi:hypothetical protein